MAEAMLTTGFLKGNLSVTMLTGDEFSSGESDDRHDEVTFDLSPENIDGNYPSKRQKVNPSTPTTLTASEIVRG